MSCRHIGYYFLASLLFCATATVAAETTDTSSSTGFQLPHDFFPIMTWEVAQRSAERFSHLDYGVASIAECGFTVAAFVKPQHLPECEKLGIKTIVGGDVWGKQWQSLSDNDITSAVQKMVDDTTASSAVIGYAIADEPGVKEFVQLAKVVAAVKRLAPGKLAYINLFPNYATIGAPNLSQLGTDSYSEYLERYIREVKPQFISYDNYRVQISLDLKLKDRAESYFTNLIEARSIARNHNLPLWHIVSSNQIRPHTTVPSPANLALQAYTTLAAGCQCLTWFTYYTRAYGYPPVDTAGQKTATWSYLKAINDQVKVIGAKTRSLESTGVYFTSPAPSASLPLLPGRLVADAESTAPLMIGEFSAAGDTNAVMVVNLSLEQSTRFRLRMASEDAKLQHVSPADGSLSPMEPGNSLWLPAGQGVLIEVTRPLPSITSAQATDQR